MNKYCLVDIFRIKNRVFLRCFRDAEIVEIHDAITATCPICKRPLEIRNDFIEPKTRKRIEVLHPKHDVWMILP